MEMQNKLGKVAGFFSVLTVLWVTGCIFLKNENWNQKRIILLIGILMIGVLLLGAAKLIGKVEEKIRDSFSLIVLIFIFLYAGLQIEVGLKLRYTPAFDLEAIYGGAIEWYTTGDFAAHKDYFYWFGNNLGGMAFLRLADFLLGGFTQDFYLIGLLTNVIGLSIAEFLAAHTGRELGGVVAGIMSLVMIALYLPCLFMGAVFYTDALSMPYLMGCFYCMIRLAKEKRPVKKILWAVLTGLLGGAGYTVKGTVLIVFVMGILVLALQKKYAHKGMVITVCIAVFCVFLSGFYMGIHKNYLIDEQRKNDNTPVWHWIMMGLEGEGAYNPQDYEFTRSFSDTKERNRALVEEIGKRFQKLGIGGTFQLFEKKTNAEFEGTLGLSDFLDDTPEKRGTLHSYLLYDGEHYSTYRNYCNVILMTLILYFGVQAGYGALRQKEFSVAQTVINLVIPGIVCFLMLWESSHRYFANYVPMLIPGASIGVIKLSQWEKLKEWKRQMRVVIKKRSCRVFIYAVGFRILLYLCSLVIMCLFGSYQEPLRFSDFLDTWTRWDSAHYINIAENTYAGAIENGQHIFLVFYPLYPWLIRILNFVVHNSQLSGILISVVCFATGCVYLDKIVTRECGKKTAENTLIMQAVFPFAFFFGAVLTESLFFSLTAMFFYYLEKKDYFEVAVVGFLACLTKNQGVLLAIAVMAELFTEGHLIRKLREKDLKGIWREILWPGIQCVPMLLGTLVYLFINYRTEGDPFRFLFYQRDHWGNGFAPIWTTITYIVKYTAARWYESDGMALWIPEFVLFFVYLAAIAYGFKKKVRPVYLCYLTAYFLLTYSSSWLISAGRYTLCALPLFMLEGKFATEHKRAGKVLILLSGLLMMVYMTGYYQWKQIM